MIPWFVVNVIGWLASPFGREVYVTATSGNWWGADRVHLIKRDPSLPRPRKLAPYRGGPLTPAPIDGVAFTKLSGAEFDGASDTIFRATAPTGAEG